MSIDDIDFLRVVELIAKLGWIDKRANGWTTVGWFRRKPVDWDTRIEQDLGCTGDDMEELMVPFFEKFGISPQGFVPRRYFHGEGFGPTSVAAMLHILIYRKPYPPGPTYDLTIRDLVNCVRAGKWVDPPFAPEWRAPGNSFREFIRSFTRSE